MEDKDGTCEERAVVVRIRTMVQRMSMCSCSALYACDIMGFRAQGKLIDENENREWINKQSGNNQGLEEQEMTIRGRTWLSRVGAKEIENIEGRVQLPVEICMDKMELRPRAGGNYGWKEQVMWRDGGLGVRIWRWIRGMVQSTSGEWR
ncbi:hypothetical protein EDB19DRAFT_1830126 [Suillus lakei]|nr:hypothetical protein EDB19DRAFT_1830126 [Suillus lakei]